MTGEMKRVAFITSYYVDNYGTFLQSFATQEILKKIGFNPELICVKCLQKEINVKRRRYYIKQALTSTMGIHKCGIFFSRIVKKTGVGDYAKNAQKRGKVFEYNRQEKLHFSPQYNSISELHDSIAERYSAVIVGSDQLWLPGNIVGDYFTLSFVPNDVNKISYSTSFGQSSVPDELKEKIKLFLNRIDCLSVRETSGQRIIKEITGRDAKVVLDPVLLFDKEYWKGYISDKPILGGDYIFCYILGKKKAGRKFAKTLKAKCNCKIVNLPNLDEYILGDDKYSDIKLYDASPFDFLNLIFYAKYVITDSFHCTAFSILFQKALFVFHRHSDKSVYSTNSRIDDLLERANLRNQLVLDDQEIDDVLLEGTISFEAAEHYIANERKESIHFLENALIRRGKEIIPG